MKKIFPFLYIFVFLVFICGCGGNENKTINNSQNCEFAKLFTIKVSGNDTIIGINENHYNKSNNFSEFYLTRNNKSADKNIIKIPLKRVICMSTSHIAYINLLGKGSTIAGVSGGRYINDKEITQGIKQGNIVDIGYESTLNYEKIIALNPDMVFTYGVSGGNNTYIDKLRQFGIPVMVLGDYAENHPLGKLEYLKLFGTLFGVPQIADSIFSVKKDRYLDLCKLVSNPTKKPKVLLNAPWKDAWYIPGEDNYMAKIIRDAGAEVLGAESGISVSKTYNIEEVYNLAQNADFWLNPNSFSSKRVLLESVNLLKDIPAVKSGNIYNNIKKITPSGGSDFWESGVVDPEIVLEDLIKIFYPELVKDHILRYYIKLED